MMTASWSTTPVGEAAAALSPCELQPLADHTQHTGRPPPEQIVVPLIPKAAEELQRLHEHTGLSWTDIVNRAVSLYQFIEAQLAAGRTVLIRDESTDETSILMIH
jgi:hypothetical protein